MDINIDIEKLSKEIMNSFDDKWKVFIMFKKCKYEDKDKQLKKIAEEDREFNIAQQVYFSMLSRKDKMLYEAKNHFAEELIDSIQARFTLLCNNFSTDEINELLKKHMEKMEERYNEK